MKKLLVVFSLLVLAACSGQPPAERPKLAKTGQPAPEISLPKLINAPLPAVNGWADLKGKAVVFEFWATWCDPCVESIPHMNDLAAKFRGRPVAFISVTDESEADVRVFLKEHPMNTWVAPESGAGIFKAFRVYGRPHVALVSIDGKVSAFTSPFDLTEERVEALVSGRAEPAPGESTGAGDKIEGGQTAAIAEFLIKKSTSSAGKAEYRDDHMYASAMPLKYALSFLMGTIDRLDVKPGAAAAMRDAYDIRLSVPPGREALKRDLFLKGLEVSLGLNVRDTSAQAEVLVLKAAPGGPINVREVKEYGGSRANGTVIEESGSTFSGLAATLADRLNEPVLDETKDGRIYRFAFDMDTYDTRALGIQLQRQLGLRLERLRRKIRVVEVSKIK